MKVTAHEDYILLERFEEKNESEFITTGIGNESPFFVVLKCDEGECDYVEGDKVIPRQDRLIFMKLDGKEYYWVMNEDIMGSENE